MSMRTVYTSDGPRVGMVIGQPAETTQRSVAGGWGGRVNFKNLTLVNNNLHE